jgi:lipid II isoglutaminyl synthase (glutamine-hydrolysing)
LLQSWRMVLFPAKAAAARAVGAVSRRTGRGGGTTLPGRILVRLAPDALTRLGANLTDGTALVSATNGKTTTAAMTAAMLAPERALCRNTAGANLVSGIASALLQRPRGARFGLFEVDEAALAQVTAGLAPGYLVLANLFRDQLDRYGELDLIADRWRLLVEGLASTTALIVNGDDPLVASIGERHPQVTRFGFDDPRHALPTLPHAADSTTCVRCHAPYQYRAVYLGHLGDYHCPRCGHERPPLDVAATRVELLGLDGSRFVVRSAEKEYPVSIALPGIYNVYNAVAALTLATRVGIAPASAAARLAGFRAAFGRFERLRTGDREVVVLLVKNPAGTNEALRTLAADLAERSVLLALNDRTADGRDVSWIWDVDYEQALPRAGRVICAGTRAADIALRAKYAGVDPARIEIAESLESGFDRVLETAGPGAIAYVLPTYTAMLELQRVAAARGLKRPYWEPTAA